MDYEVGLLECAARNNPQASRSVQKLPLLIITTIFPAVHVGFHPTVGFYPTADFIQLLDFRIPALFLRLSQRHSLGFAAHPQ